MAIKFSQFVVQTDASTLSHIVGYNGVDNIQITPTNFLNSLLTGTAGQVLFYDTTGVTGDNGFYWDNTNKRLGIGTSTPGNKIEVQTTSNGHGVLFKSNATQIGSIFRTAIGGTVSMTIDGAGTRPININNSSSSNVLIANGGGNVGVGTTAPGAKLDVDTGRIQISSSGTKQLSFGTDATIEFGSDSNMQVRRSGSSLQFKTGGSEVMRIDSAGNVGIGTTTPSAKLEVSGNIKVGDSEQFIAGTGNDLKIYHDGTDSVIQNDIGDLEIQNRQDDGNIVFKSDDGSGGVATYFYLDGQNTRTEFLKDVKFPDNVKANFGTSVDLQIHHDGTNSLILNDTGRLIIRNRADDQDIEFDCDDGAGGVTTYFYLDGGGVLTRFDKRLRMSDAVGLQLGSSGNFEMYHFSGNTTMDNFTGNLTIRNSANDKDISFACDDGSGGAATYFFLDGSTASGGSLYTQFPDNSNLTFGAGNDLRIYHNGTNSNIENFNGTLQFVQNLNDGDIKFLCDDGSAGDRDWETNLT